MIQFFPDSQTAVAALLGGDVDYLEKATLGAGAEVQTVLDAEKEGKLSRRDHRQPDLGARRLQPVHQVTRQASWSLLAICRQPRRNRERGQFPSLHTEKWRAGPTRQR